MLNSARFKLTLFYLAVFAIFSLLLTFGIRTMAQREFAQSNSVERGTVQFLERYFGNTTEIEIRPGSYFEDVQEEQAALVHRHLNIDLILFNIGALLVGGALSYWYAGRALRPLVEAHDSQKRFAADASHEMRTPLANLQLENEVFLRQKSFSESSARELIASNLEEVRRLENLANSLLSLTQYENAALALGKVQIRAVVEEALTQTHAAFQAKNVHVSQHVAMAKVLGERESLIRLIAIVLDNAAKYGPEKGTVYITGTASSGQYTLKIRDEGPGIAPSDLPHIFDRLYRGDQARSSATGGYGLGLALAKRIAALNAVTIEAGNHPKSGALITLTFNLAKRK